MNLCETSFKQGDTKTINENIIQKLCPCAFELYNEKSIEYFAFTAFNCCIFPKAVMIK